MSRWDKCLPSAQTLLECIIYFDVNSLVVLTSKFHKSLLCTDDYKVFTCQAATIN